MSATAFAQPLSACRPPAQQRCLPRASLPLPPSHIKQQSRTDTCSRRPHTRCQLRALQQEEAVDTTADAASISSDQPSAEAIAEVNQLREDWAIPGYIDIEHGRGGLPKVVIKHLCGSRVEIYLQGATVTSWIQPSGDDVLYTRKDAVFERGKPIAGGLPICFPQYGDREYDVTAPGHLGRTRGETLSNEQEPAGSPTSDKLEPAGSPLQRHGFASSATWQLGYTTYSPMLENRIPVVEFILTDTEETRRQWPHPFKAVLSVALDGEHLVEELAIINTGDAPLSFTAGIQGYYEVLDIEYARIGALEQLKYIDRIDGGKVKVEKRDVVEFSGPVDSLYSNAYGALEVDVGTGAAVVVASEGWTDLAVWNPWDAEPDFDSFVRVDHASARTPITLAPGEDWTAHQFFEVVDLTSMKEELGTNELPAFEFKKPMFYRPEDPPTK